MLQPKVNFRSIRLMTIFFLSLILKSDMSEIKETYTIQEVGKIHNLTVETIRYYEKNGILFPIQRLENGHRVFQKWDLEWINFVNLLKSTGMPLSAIKEYRKLVEDGDQTNEERLSIMIKHRKSIIEQMDHLKICLERINYKIDYYSDALNKKTS